jgi:uncharacterized protein YecE (DUF72 family)
MSLHIGASGWSYPAWEPAFYPEKLPQKRFLEFYSTQLNSVELNATLFAQLQSLTWVSADNSEIFLKEIV